MVSRVQTNLNLVKIKTLHVLQLLISQVNGIKSQQFMLLFPHMRLSSYLLHAFQSKECRFKPQRHKESFFSNRPQIKLINPKHIYNPQKMKKKGHEIQKNKRKIKRKAKSYACTGKSLPKEKTILKIRRRTRSVNT